MDGKLRVLNVEKDGLRMTEEHFVETSWGVTAHLYISFSQTQQEFIILGYQDGSVHVYDYTRYKAQNFKKLLFSVQGMGNDANEERFCDSKYQH